ncbi:unnamed protein product [Closterium sp. Naga37s-1]|nr:unnamed protein product [Closterium sp. Naga37s-1]
MEARGRTIADGPLAALFVLNNANYISSSISSGRMRDAIRHSDRLADYESAFERAALCKLLACLEPLEVSAKMSADGVKQRLKRFNAVFEEVALEQRRWLVLSDSCRKAMRVRFAKVIKGSYMDFLTPHR